MKKHIKISLIISAVLVLVISVASAVFSFFAMVYHFDHAIQHFNNDSILPALGMYLPFAAPIIGIVCALFLHKGASFTKSPGMGIPTVFTSVFMGCLMIISAVIPFIGNSQPLGRMTAGACVFAVIAGLYFALTPFVKNQWFSILSFAPAIWAALKLLEEYFREGSPINAPLKTVNITMFAFILLFFAEEVRFIIGAQLPPIYYFSLLSAAAFTCSATLPKLAFIVLLNKKTAFDFNIIDCCLGVAILFYIITKFIDSLPVLGNYVERKKKKS